MRRFSFAIAAIALLAGGVQQASAEYARTALNLRSGPGTNYNIIATIPYCGQVQVYARNYGWCDVLWNGYRGWASCRYLVNSCGGYGGGGYRGGGGYSGGGY